MRKWRKRERGVGLTGEGVVEGPEWEREREEVRVGE